MTRGWARYRLPGFTLDTTWEAPPGTVTVLYGPSGAGKSMTLRAIAGLVRPHQGHIEVGDAVVFDSETGIWTPPHRRRVGYLPQNYGLFPHLTVVGNITFGLKRGNDDGASGHARAMELVRTFHLEGFEQRRPDALSGGQQQRVALARALASDPLVLLLDEPFAALDLELRRTVRREIRDILTSSRIPILLVTHDAEEALALADRVQIIDLGTVVAAGNPLDVIEQPPQERVARLTGIENLLHMTVASVHAREGTMTCLTNGDVGLETPFAVDSQAGTEVTIGIRAADIIIATTEPTGLSARNVLPCTVVSLDPHAPGYNVMLDCHGLLIVAHVTRSAVEELDVRVGRPIWAVIKASSCFVLQRE